MNKIIFTLIMAWSFQGLAQSDSTYNGILGKTKTPYAFEKGLLFITPSVGVVKGTKNNFGLEIEHGFHKKTGVALGISRSTLSEVQRYFNDTHWGVAIGIRHHISPAIQSMMFDLMPGIYASHLFSGIELNDKKEQFKLNNAIGLGLDTRLFVSPHFGFSISSGILLKKNSKVGFGFGLVFK